MFTLKGVWGKLRDDLAQALAESDAKIAIQLPDGLRIITRESLNPDLRNNGVDYDYWREYRMSGRGVIARDGCSCDFWQPEPQTCHYPGVTLAELEAILVFARERGAQTTK